MVYRLKEYIYGVILSVSFFSPLNIFWGYLCNSSTFIFICPMFSHCRNEHNVSILRLRAISLFPTDPYEQSCGLRHSGARLIQTLVHVSKRDQEVLLLSYRIRVLSALVDIPKLLYKIRNHRAFPSSEYKVSFFSPSFLTNSCNCQIVVCFPIWWVWIGSSLL